MESQLGIGKGNKRLNSNSFDLQDRIDLARDQFTESVSVMIGNRHHTFLKNGMLGEILARTPVLIYDLPELVAHIDTAFVDTSGKMYFSAEFARLLLDEHEAGHDSLNFLFRHEAEHLRRLHLARMADLPPAIAGRAQDIRINIDITKTAAAAAIVAEKVERRTTSSGNVDISPQELAKAVQHYLNTIPKATAGGGCAMTYEAHVKYDGMSEEEIGALLMKDWKEPPPIPDREISFPHIMEGAAQEAENVAQAMAAEIQQPGSKGKKAIQAQNGDPIGSADLKKLAGELRRIGAAKANPAQVTDQAIEDGQGALGLLKGHRLLKILDLLHEGGVQAKAGTGVEHASANTGDAYLDILKPSDRVELAKGILNSILANGMQGPEAERKGPPAYTVKDLERMRRGKGSQDSQPSPGQKPGDKNEDKGDPNTIPSPNAIGAPDHVMSTEDLANLLAKAGVRQETMEKLGYNDLDKLPESAQACKDMIVGAINQASEDQMTVGNMSPGGHLLNYAKAQMLDFFKPVLTWEMVYKKVLETLGRGIRHDPMEPWAIYSVNAADMGFQRQSDVPYMGSMVPGKLQKPLFISLYDTSTSVNDGMLKRHISEGINMSRKVSRGNAPDVVHVCADTIARGEPVYITERNYKEVLKTGFNYGGRGGTNFQASIEAAFELVKPGRKGPDGKRLPYAGRTIEALVFFTDTGDSPPDPVRLLAKARECGMKKLPTTIFIAPKSTYSDHFKNAISSWARIVYYDHKAGMTKINVNEATAAQDLAMRAIDKESASVRRPRP
ncbi:MAG: VWA domain-containing protein [Polaromonas sp.]|nr:VWA domain-containing protein [Polaromonas sp.]